MSLSGPIIGLDFDGTMVEHRFPEIGDTVPDAIRVVRRMADKGCKMILHTCRTNQHLRLAVRWYEKRVKRELWGINANRLEDPYPGIHKLYADWYVDDKGLGCPLILDSGGVPCVNWMQVEKAFEKAGILPPTCDFEDCHDPVHPEALALCENHHIKFRITPGYNPLRKED